MRTGRAYGFFDYNKPDSNETLIDLMGEHAKRANFQDDLRFRVLSSNQIAEFPAQIVEVARKTEVHGSSF